MSGVPSRESLDALSAALEGCAELLHVHLDRAARRARVDFALLGDLDDGSTVVRRTFSFEMSGLSQLVLDFGDCRLPPELASVTEPSEALVNLAISCFRRQFIYEWTLFPLVAEGLYTRSRQPWIISLAPNAPTADNPCLAVFVEGIGGHVVWTLGLRFETLMIRSWIAIDGETDIAAFIGAVRALHTEQ